MKKYSPLLTINVTLLTLWFVVYVLFIGSSIIIPFVVAVLLSFMILSISNFYSKKWLQKTLSFIVAIFTIWLVFYGIWKVINSNIEEIIVAAPEYQEKLMSLFDVYAEKYELDATLLRDQVVAKINFTSLLSWAAAAITSILKNTGIILLFTIFILLESKSFRSKLALITGWDKSTFFNVFGQIQDDIKSYFVIKTITSIAVGLLSAIIMFFFGLDFLIFWAFIIFLLNYIPSVGSIIAVSFPVMFSLVQFESPYLTMIFLICMIWVQIFIWNLVEPRLMGNKLNISPLVILVSLVFWGTLWGPVGMLLSVPIMVMINITLAHIEVTRPIAVLLSEKWIVKFTPPKWGVSKTYSLNKMKRLLKSSK